jgi:hypothetical protein
MSPMSPSDLHECSASRAAGLPPLLQALWHEAHGNWDRAHSITQDIESYDAAWLHAYLHRKEGDDSNASYWYHRANRQVFAGSFHAEWTALATHLLKGGEVANPAGNSAAPKGPAT